METAFIVLFIIAGTTLGAAGVLHLIAPYMIPTIYRLLLVGGVTSIATAVVGILK